MNKNIKQLKKLFKEVHAAKKLKNEAMLSITSIGTLPLDDNRPQSCITSVALVEGREPIYISLVCQSFKRGENCKNQQCPIFDKNIQYSKACEEYKKVRQIRREFIKGLFIRSK